MSECRKNILCNFEKEKDFPDAIVEVCTFCGKRVVYYKNKNGKIDNEKYLEDHKRDFLQPYGKDRQLFIKIWGYEGIETAKKFLEKQVPKSKRYDVRADLRERRIAFHKRAMGHRIIKEDWEPPRHERTTGFQKVPKK